MVEKKANKTQLLLIAIIIVLCISVTYQYKVIENRTDEVSKWYEQYMDKYCMCIEPTTVYNNGGNPNAFENPNQNTTWPSK